MKMVITFDYAKKIGTVAVKEGLVTAELFLHYLENCRKQLEPDWISVIDLFDAMSIADFEIDDISKIAEKSRTVSEIYPVKCIVVIAKDPFTTGLSQIFKQMVESDKGHGHVYVVESKEEADRTIDIILTKD